MFRWYLKNLLFIGLVLLFSVPGLQSFAMQDTLTLEQVLEDALNHAFDIKLTTIDIDIAKTQVQEARSDYYPTVRARANTEYQLNLVNGNQNTPVAIIGDSILPGTTAFQNSAGVNLSYTVLDFGQRAKRVQMGKAGVNEKQSLLGKQMRELQLKLVELYGDGLEVSKDIQAKQQLLAQYRQLYAMKQRLFDAGVIAKVDVAEAAIQVTKMLDDIEALNLQWDKVRQNMSLYTQKPYSPTIQLAGIQEVQPPAAASFHIEEMPDILMLDAEMDKKQAELELLKRQRWLPTVNLYSSYSMFGGDRRDIINAYNNIKPRTTTVGLFLNYTLFDGFKYNAQSRRAQLELKRLDIEKQKQSFELGQNYQQLQSETARHNARLDTKAKLITETTEKQTMLERLSLQELIEKTRVLEGLIDTLLSQREHDKVNDKRLITLRKMALYHGDVP